MTPRQRFQAGSKKLLTSVNASMQVLTSPRQKTKDLSIAKDGSGESTSSFGNLRIEDGEEVRATAGIMHGLRDEGDISREAAMMRRWIEQLIDDGQEDEVFPDEETIKEELNEAWGKGKGRAL